MSLLYVSVVFQPYQGNFVFSWQKLLKKTVANQNAVVEPSSSGHISTMLSHLRFRDITEEEAQRTKEPVCCDCLLLISETRSIKLHQQDHQNVSWTRITPRNMQKWTGKTNNNMASVLHNELQTWGDLATGGVPSLGKEPTNCCPVMHGQPRTQIYMEDCMDSTSYI